MNEQLPNNLDSVINSKPLINGFFGETHFKLKLEKSPKLVIAQRYRRHILNLLDPTSHEESELDELDFAMKPLKIRFVAELQQVLEQYGVKFSSYRQLNMIQSQVASDFDQRMKKLDSEMAPYLEQSLKKLVL